MIFAHASSSFLRCGLAALSLIGLAALPARAGNSDYSYSATFTTPAAFQGPGNGDISFSFNPSGANPAPAQLTVSNLGYSSGWSVDPLNTTFVGIHTLSFFPPSVTLYNSQNISGNGFAVPVSKWGDSFSLDFHYTDPPGTDPTDFTLALQKSGLPDASLFDVRFDPSGTATLMSSAPGVTITSQAGTPGLVNPVPEASTTVSLGLLLALGFGGMIVAAKRRKAPTAE